MHSYSTDQPKRHRRYILIGAASAVLYLELPILIGPIAGISFSLLSTVLYITFTKYLWKWKFLHEIGLVGVPNLNGTWKGHLYSSADPSDIPSKEIVNDGRQIEDKTKMKTKIEIEQTWDQILVTLDGAESASSSQAATILLNEKAWPTLSYNYFNDGGNSRDKVRAFYGSAILEYDAAENKLEGRYFNRPDQRGTHGIIELWRKDPSD